MKEGKSPRVAGKRKDPFEWIGNVVTPFAGRGLSLSCGMGGPGSKGDSGTIRTVGRVTEGAGVEYA